MRDPRTREAFSIYACTACELGQTEPAPADLARYYDSTYHGGRHGFTARYCAKRRLRWLVQLAGKERGRKLLDIGCGDGTFMLFAQEAGWKVMGTELDPTLPRSFGLDVKSDIDDLSGAGPFDAITLWHSLEHLADPKGMLTSATRLLAPNGLLVIAVPDARGLQARLFGAKWFHLDVPRHLYHFSSGSLSKLIESAGHTVVRSWHQEFEYDLLGWTQSALNRVFSTPNMFFDQLTHRPMTCGTLTRVASRVLGVAISAPALVLVGLGTLIRRGGTLVMAGKSIQS